MQTDKKITPTSALAPGAKNIIQTNVPLKDKNWFRTGGPAAYFSAPTTAEEFQEALLFAREKGLEIFVLGAGANVLISDDGFDGLVIQPRLVETVRYPSTSSGRTEKKNNLDNVKEKKRTYKPVRPEPVEGCEHLTAKRSFNNRRRRCRNARFDNPLPG